MAGVVRILYTADLHSNPKACRRFVEVLDTHGFNIGVIGGDLTEGYIPEKKLISMLDGVTENDFLPNLYGPDDDVTSKLGKEWYTHDSILMRGLKIEEEKLKAILTATEKPIFIIPGNHDRTEWKNHKNIYNIHGKSIKLGKYNFVGYRYCGLEKIESEIANDLHKLKDLIHENTIFVTHSPPYNILDRAHHGALIGSRSIAAIVTERKPKFNLFGHVHESFGVRGNYVNGSYVLGERFFSIDLEADKVKIVSIKKR